MIPHNRPTLGIEEEQAALRVIKSGWVAQGKEVKSFEDEVCGFLGLAKNHAVAVSSGTAALFLALKVLKAESRKVAYPVYACSALRNAAAMAGAKDIIIDTDIDSPNIDMEAFNKSGANIVIVPHMFGLPIKLSLAKKIDIIEDCAQSLGSKIEGKYTGLSGKIGIYSFYATKLITSGGYGGMLVSKDKNIIDAVRDYREFDQRRDSKKRFNFYMSDIQAAIGRAQLKKLSGFIKRREEIFGIYKNAGLDLVDSEIESAVPVRYRAVVRTANPKKMINRLKSKGIRAIIPIEDWELLGRKQNALRFSRHTVSLPIYPLLTDREAKMIAREAGNI